MVRSYHELGEDTSQQSWRRIRNLRAAPPQSIAVVLQANASRADVFHTGLEQSEQLFRAAALVERESRPLLLFYGLGQAGRALAAASAALPDKGQAWAGNGHGLQAVNLDSWNPAGLWDAVVRVSPSPSPPKDPRDLFSRASIALGSALDLQEVRMGDLAANIAEFIAEFPSFGPTKPLLHLESLSRPAQAAGSAVVTFPLRVPPGVADAETFIRGYPALAAYPLLLDEADMPVVDHNGWHILQVPTSDIDWRSGSGELIGRQVYRGSPVAVAAMAGSAAPVHPLMIWWTLLYALSMLARYEPSRWHAILDIRRSAVWSQVEYLQDRALDAVPELLAAALRDLGSEAA